MTTHHFSTERWVAAKLLPTLHFYLPLNFDKIRFFVAEAGGQEKDLAHPTLVERNQVEKIWFLKKC